MLLRLIGKWLNAGVHEAGSISHPEAGTPQGGVISPLLANIYLHEVLDEWVEEEVKPRLKGRAFLVRFADDFVLGFSNEEDARRVMDVLPKRLGKYGLDLHPEKTRLLRFLPPREGRQDMPSESFDFLGFNHHWEKSRKGRWVIKRKTATSRFTRALKRVAEWCRVFRHREIKEQHQHLSAALRGHYGYYGIIGNSQALGYFAFEVEKVWRKWLARRSQRGMSWESFNRMVKRFALPPPRTTHSVLRAANP